MVVARITFRNRTLILLLAGALVRMLQWLPFSVTADYPDSFTYLNYTANVFNGEVDKLRTPVYPFFIHLFEGRFMMLSVVCVQTLLSLVSIVFFIKLVKRFVTNAFLSFVCVLVYATSPSLIGFDQCILTESVAISLVVVVIAVFEERSTALKAILISCLLFLAVFLRPSLQILLMAVTVLWVFDLFKKNLRAQAIMGLGCVLVIAISLVNYSLLNERQNGYKGVSIVDRYNRFDIVVNTGVFANSSDEEIKSVITEALPADTNAYHADLRNALEKRFTQKRVSAFIDECSFEQPWSYVTGCMSHFLNVTGAQSTFVLGPKRDDSLLGKGFVFYNLLLSFSFFFLFLFLIAEGIHLALIERSKKKLFLWLIATGHMGMLIFFAPTEYGRLFVAALPATYILLFARIDCLLPVRQE